jgi:hypothetical protein
MQHLTWPAHAGLCIALLGGSAVAHGAEPQPPMPEGQRLFELETFGGNGRTCRTCHSRETGTVSPAEAQARFLADADDPLFLFDGSDDGQGHGVSRLLRDATILVTIPLPANVRLADDPSARSVVLRRGIPTTLNTPALDPILMLDGREPRLESQATHAIAGHAQAVLVPSTEQLASIAEFERSERFFSSSELQEFADGGDAPGLPEGCTPAEKRGRRFFEDLPGGADGKDGLCAACHSGPMLDQTNEFLPVPVPVGTRFIGVLVSQFNVAANPVREFIFNNGDGTETSVPSPDPGRALITGAAGDANDFKISSLRGISKTAPYFHDNSAKTLEEVAAHYARFFAIVTAPDSPGPAEPAIVLTPEEQADMVAYLKLL